MKRFLFFSMLVVLVELGLTYLISTKVETRFLDLMFYLGVAFVTITLFFSSTGGLISNRSDASVMNSLEGAFGGFKHKREFGSVSLNPLVGGSILYFILGILLATFFY